MQSCGESIGMNITVHERDGIVPVPSLWAGIGRLHHLACDSTEPLTIAVIGAGGKTTCIYALAKELTRCHKKVLIVTTTHMYEPHADIFAGMDERRVEALWETVGIAVAGRPCDNGKIGYVGDDVYARLKRKAHVVLVEADGARRLPIKVCGPKEPVLPDSCQAILAVAGLSALGKPLEDVCFRSDEAEALGVASASSWKRDGRDDKNLVDMDLFARLFQRGVIEKVAPFSIPIIPVFNQADTVARRIAADVMFQDLGLWGLSTSFLSKGDC